jgi:uncharacterized protein YbbC (DUF1343 family)
MRVQNGIDVLQREAFARLQGLRVGLFTNARATDSALVPTLERFAGAKGVHLAALFAPEHGIFGAEADGAHVYTHTDARLGIPVHSLYGDTFRPTPDMLNGLDVMVCDIQDVGVRYYTFLWSLTEVVEACAQYGIRVLILDRPNPLGGRVYGAPLEEGFASLVGRYNVPTQHGMTLAEMARYVNTTLQAHKAQIDVVPCKGWHRGMTFVQTEQAWVAPSPAMATPTTNAHYSGACLLEGTNASEGRGTSHPFEVVGAPYISDPFALAETLNHRLSDAWGVRFRPHAFKPTASKFSGVLCYGVQAHILDGARYNALVVWLEVIAHLRHTYAEFAWLPPYQDGGLRPFDRLIGSDDVRLRIDAGETIASIGASWQAYSDAFQQASKPFWLYA